MIATALAWKIGIGGALLLGSGVGLYSCHRSAVRNAQQQQEADTRSQVLTELNAQHAIEMQKREERITELETRFNELAKTRASSKQQIEIITKQAESERAEVTNLDVNGVRAAIRERLVRAAASTDTR